MGRTHHAVRRPRSTARSGGGGFTLIELVALLTVLGTLAVLAVPALGRLDDSRAGLASARVRTVVAYAQRWAMATLDPTWVVVDTSANRIEVLTASSTNPSTTSVAQTGPVPTSTALQPVVNPNSGSALVLDLADYGVQILAATPSEKFFFDGTGSPFAGDGSAFTQDGVIKLSGDTYVTVSRGTGLVRVH